MPAYTDIRLSKEIYISSSTDYFVKVFYQYQTLRWTRSYWFAGRGLQGVNSPHVVKMPRYVIREVERQLLELLKSDRVVYHEYDRDHNKRYSDLRYHRSEIVEDMISMLEASTQNEDVQVVPQTYLEPVQPTTPEQLDSQLQTAAYVVAKWRGFFGEER